MWFSNILMYFASPCRVFPSFLGHQQIIKPALISPVCGVRILAGSMTQKIQENPLKFLTGATSTSARVRGPHRYFQTDGGRCQGWVTGRGYHFLTGGLGFKAGAELVSSHVVSQAEGHWNPMKPPRDTREATGCVLGEVAASTKCIATL